MTGAFALRARKLIRPRDLLIAASVLLAALAFFLYDSTRPAGEEAVIRQNGEVIKTVGLSQVKEPYTIELSGEIPATLLIERDGVRFLSAGCPDKLCVRTGKISKAGQTAVCLPAKITVTIEGGTPDVDGVTG